jgi:hypothetical protein
MQDTQPEHGRALRVTHEVLCADSLVARERNTAAGEVLVAGRKC